MSQAQWIWCTQHPEADEYGEFTDRFFYRSGGAVLAVSADSNYEAYLNGELIAFGQYADYPYDKVFDEIDLTPYCREGENRLSIRVWYYGIEDSSTYFRGNAGLWYRITSDSEVLCQSGETTLSRMSPAYLPHRKKRITGQLGLSFAYDATKEDGWTSRDADGFHPSFPVAQTLPLRPRPCKRLLLLPLTEAVPCKVLSETDAVYDLGKETVGFLDFELSSESEQNLVISYGEHLADGCVRRTIGGRDFSVEYRAKAGRNRFVNAFRRLGCRYLEVQSEHPVTVHRIGIRPTVYPVEIRPAPKLDEPEQTIYRMCEETLRACMHEHYEDCPWREQALYTMDSRNQMLCGYYAFGETAFPRANLELISHDDRPDRILSICYPASVKLAIPSFSLHYFTSCREYLEHSGDTDFLRSIYPKLTDLLGAFTEREVNGLIPPFRKEGYWDFYEWRKGLDGYGSCPAGEEALPDVVLNALLSLALQNMAVISRALDIDQDYTAQAEKLNGRIRREFYDENAKVFFDRPTHTTRSQLGNALAVLCGAVTGEEAAAVAEKLRTDTQMTPVSLSMCCFKYDAWMKVDAEKYRDTIFGEIRSKYLPMIDAGSTTVWETEVGESDFDRAGSLCHGWSAIPIYYYHRYAEQKN